MVTMLEVCSTEEQHSVVWFFLWAKGLDARMLMKKCFLFMVGSVCHVKQFASGLVNYLKDIQKSQMMPDQVWK
jgi:hypothetical protein